MFRGPALRFPIGPQMKADKRFRDFILLKNAQRFITVFGREIKLIRWIFWFFKTILNKQVYKMVQMVEGFFRLRDRAG